MGNDIGAQQNYQRSVLDAINTVVQRRIDGLKLDKTVVGIIDKNIGMLAGYPLYQVKYEGGVFTATARDASESYARNTAVYVMIPQSDFSKEKFIIGRASSIATTSAESASISAAINNYVRLGPNLIPNKSIYGLHSYHDPKEEIDNPNSYQHRFNFLYEVNGEGSTDVNVLQNLFKTYAADATNILLRADFRTNLDVVQQRSAGGRYGLAVTLTFTNPNAGYGETQGEILDNLGGTIVGKAQRITTADDSYIVDVHTNEAKENNNENEQGWVGNFNLDNISLKDWDKQLQLFFNSKDVDKSKIKIWQKDGVGLFDCYTQYIQTVYQTFCINNAALQSSMTDNLVAAYLNLLSDLKNATNIENPNEDVTIADIKRIYNDWKATSIGDLSDVDEIIYLTSDSMLGDPFTYTQWNNQYVIPSQRYDFSRFKEVKSIVFFKDGFKEDSEQEQLWPPSDAPKNGGEGWDIFCRNIQLFLLKDLDSEYQGFSLKVECAEGYDGVLKTLSSNEKTAFNAHVYRNQIEELTSNANIQYIWLKQNSQVINAKHADYYHYAGVGWKRLKNTNRFFFQTTGNENWAYKNLYKCIALYQTSTEIIPLSTTFTVYNDAVSTKVKLESDLGTAFTFSEGAPTITCLIEEAPLPGKTGEEAENYQEYGYNEENSLYKYQWSIADSNNSSIIFLTEAFTNDTANVFKDNLISKIKMWYWDRENQKLKETRNPTKATRIQYPVSLSSSGFTVECIVQKNFSISDISTNTSNYYDVGNDSIEISNLKMASSSSYRIVIENGDQVFQYDEYGNAPTVTKLKDPLVIKPLRAKILGPTGLEFSGENANIEWIFNLDDTMIVPTEKLVLNPATQQEQLLKGDTCTFDITKLYNPNAQNNQITCHANFNNIDVYTDTKFYFGKVGSNGTNGTDMVSKISYDGNDNYFVLNSQPLTLYVQKDVPIANSTSGEIATQAMFNVPDSENDNNLKTTQVITSEQVLNVHLYQKGEEVEETNFSTGYPRWNLAGNANGTTNNTGKYFILDKGNKITWDFTENDDKKHLLLQNIKSEVKLKNSDQVYYSFFSLPIIEYEKNPNLVINKMLPMQRIAIEKATYLNDVVYNADGRNPIFNHNQGLKLINLPKDSIIHWIARGGLNAIKSEHSNIVQEYFETEPCFSIGFEKNTKDTYSELVSKRSSSSYNNDEQIIQVIEDDVNEAMIYILPNDVYDGSATNNRVEAKIYVPNEDSTDWNLYATVYAPINMTLNTFGLASLNAWDGNTVTIDEDGGYIMAPQIGAGEKDANNRFTGILMGKTETYTGGGDLEEEVGLFGYANGLQSIFLDSKTGNATFGLPDVETEYDDNDNLISRKYKNTNRDSNDDYNEGRIELRPGGTSKIGGWRLGRRGLYYVVDNKGKLVDIGSGHQIDYIPNVETGEFEKKDNTDSNNKSPYSSHHEKDIPYNNSGILLHSGVNPYISIKGHQFTKDEIATADIEYIRPEDSLELQLDPKAPTLFTIFRHNGSQWKDKSWVNGQIESTVRYETGSRTFLAGINGKGEFVANTVSSILVNNKKDVYTTQFSVNSFRAFNDLSVPNNPNSSENEPEIIEFPEHTGLRIKLGPHILGQMFINNNGFDADEDNENHDPTLYITGGQTSENGEYARPLSLHGKHINLFAQGSTSDQKLLPVTDSELSLNTNSFKINLGSSTHDNSKPYTTLKLFRDIDELNNLMTTGDFKLNAGLENNKNLSSEELFIYYYDGKNIKSIDKRNNPSIYIPYIEKGQTFYFKDNSWSKDFSYYRVDKEDSVDYISEENYPTCYKCVDKINENKIYYYLEDDFKWNYYKVNNLPSEVNSSEYSYLSEDYVKNHRYIKENNAYNLVAAETSYNTTNQQYVAIPVELRADDLNQNYVYILKNNVDVEKLYGIVNINNADEYVYSVSRKEYYKLSNTEYIESDILEIKEQLKDSNNNYYDLSNVDLDLIYYRRKNTNIYFLKTEFDILWVEEDHIEISPEQNDDSDESDESNDVDYRIYNDTNIEDQQLSLDKIYFQYNDEYIPLSEVEYIPLSNTETISLSDVEFIEYVLINSTPPKYLNKKVANFQRVYQINNNINKILSEEEYRQTINSNNLYYQVKDINDTSYYIFKNLFATINFDYYHLLNNSLINNSNYILQKDLNLTRSYTYDTEDKIYKEDNKGNFYQTYIVDLKDTYKYIPIKTSNNSTSDPYININNKYFSNSLYLTSELSVWFLKNNFNINTEKKYYYYFDNQRKLVVKELENLDIYYAVWTTENTLRYVSKDYLDEYDGEKYIYLNGGFKKIATNPDLNKDISISFSTKNYELYAGKYTSRITTNETSNRYASLEIDGSENLSGINFHNSTGPISMYTNSIFDFKTAFGGHISFRNDRQTTFNEEAVLGKFVIIGEEYEKGLNLTENWLRLKNEKIQIEGPTQINLFSEKRGNGAVYDITNPQIVLRAGSSSAIVPGATKATDGAAVELILNSSNNGWATVIERTNLENRMSHPVFAIRTTYSGIGIYPEIFTDNQGTRLYSELFYVKMPQYNSMGLTVQGEIPGKFGIGLDVLKDALFGGDLTTRGFFRGNGTHITNTCDGGGAGPSGPNGSTGLGKSISLTIPSINVNQQGRPSFGTKNVSFTYDMPKASDIPYGNHSNVAAALSDLAGKIAELKNSNYATQKWVKDHFAPKSHVHLLWYTRTQITDKNGNSHHVVSGIDRHWGTNLVYLSNS